ncbi:putative neutral zinc metallopeptidase [Kordia sp. SMS9]|uniref:zinc metallopeptidase n=1 Tax=Kordia sp. SMS9 TaxID=2282170 RepID=UPI000E0DFA83|nr:zinc metallopeptidase [Kordia sp. SMS9]AXG68419.1 putative neutral zinc metallopeptidase [Kordia sp. SMS9]
MFSSGYMLLAGAIMLVSMFVSNKLKSKFSHYSKLHLRNGMSGAEIAEKMLADHGIRDVEVIHVKGMLTDHYNPQKKTVNLSEGVYSQRNAAAAAVAAHEVGHAVQHAKAYKWLKMRSQLVPLVSIASKFSQWVIYGGIALMASQQAAGGTSTGRTLLIIGLIMFATGTLFSFITLPVEYDASNRALRWLRDKNMVTQEEFAGSQDALKWAARTYVVAALGSLATFLYFARYLNRK